MGRIDTYPNTTNPASTDLLLVEAADGSSTRKVTVNTFRTTGTARAITSTSPAVSPLTVTHTVPDLAGNPTMWSVYANLNYQATDVSTPLNVGLVGIRSAVNVGSQSVPVAATGSVLGVEASVIVRNTTQAGAEHAAYFGVLRYDADGVNGGTPGRGWLTDFTVHGAIGVQQQILTGVNVVLANYYNGQPLENPSCAYSASAGTGIGGSLDAAHSAATRYPGGDGYWVGGLTSGSARGFDYGFRVGGSGGPWGVTTSKVGWGFDARDYDTAGLRLHDRSGTAASLIIESTAGPMAVGRSTALSTVATFAGPFAAPAADPASAMVSFLSSDAQLINRGASIGLGGATNDGATTFRCFASLAGRKANGTTTDTSGYLAMYTNKNGVGFVERIRVSEDGDLRLLTNFMEWDEIADPAAPAANKARLYAKDNGAGKTQLVVRFPTGAVQVLATEP